MSDYFKKWNLEKLPYDYEMSNDEYALRQMIWMSHGEVGKHFLYGDDGELNCNTCFLDFKRLTVMSIYNALHDQSMKKVIEDYKKMQEEKESESENEEYIPSSIDGIICKIKNCDEVEIMEFDFDDCFEAMKRMENALLSFKKQYRLSPHIVKQVDLALGIEEEIQIEEDHF